MVTTLTPQGMSSVRRQALTASAACFEPQYGAINGTGMRPAIEVTFTTLGAAIDDEDDDDLAPARFRRGRRALVTRIIPKQLTSMSRRKSARSSQSTQPPDPTPALFTSA